MTTALTKREKLAGAYGLPMASEAIERIEQVVGGRRELVAALLAAPPDEALTYVIGLIADPRNDQTKLSALCAMGDITVGEVIAAYKAGVTAVVQIQATQQVVAAVPTVIEDLTTRAGPHEIECRECRGTGKTADGVGECTHCRGRGGILTLPDLERQKEVLRLAGLGEQKTGVVVQNDNRKLTIAPDSATGMAKLLEATDRLIASMPIDHTPVTDDVTDAEPVAPEDPGP